MKEIKLSRGQIALVDDEDFEAISKYKWALGKDGYAISSRRKGKGLGHLNFKMHRVVMNAQKGQIIDHANRNPLDNRKENLRFCTHSQNSANTNGSGRNTSGYHGVNFFNRPSPKKWRASIAGELIGYYLDPRTAAFMYDQAAKKHFGEFARLNFPNKHPKRGQ